MNSTDSGQTWLGLTFQGTPGGSGCPANGYKGAAGSTADAAKSWLLTEYIGQGYCCATATPTSVPTTSPLSCSQVPTTSSTSLVGQVIGTGANRCEIFDETNCGTCACNYYVKYR